MANCWDDTDDTRECQYCKQYISNSKFQIHVLKCSRKHKGKKALKICSVDSSHHVPEHEYEEHVKNCEREYGIDESHEQLKIQIEETLPDSEIEYNVNSVDYFQAMALDSKKVRTIQAVWGLNKEQRNEWKKAEFQRVQNLKEGKSIDDILFPKANGEYVRCGDLKKKLRNRSRVNKPKQVCSNEASIKENSKENSDIKCSTLQVSERKNIKKKETPDSNENSSEVRYLLNEQLLRCDLPLKNNCIPSEQTGARKKNQSRKKQNESTSDGRTIMEVSTGNEIFCRNSESINVEKPINMWERKNATSPSKSASNIPEILCETFSPNFVARFHKSTSATSDNLSGARKKAALKGRKNADKVFHESTKAASTERYSSINSRWCDIAQQNHHQKNVPAALRPCEEASNVPEKVYENVFPDSVHFYKDISNDPSVKTKTSEKIRNEAASTNDLKENLNTSSNSDSGGNWIVQEKKNRRKKKPAEISNIPEVFNKNIFSSSVNYPTTNKPITEHSVARKKISKGISNDPSVKTKTSGKIKNEAASTNDPKENLNTSSNFDFGGNWIVHKKINKRKKKSRRSLKHSGSI